MNPRPRHLVPPGRLRRCTARTGPGRLRPRSRRERIAVDRAPRRAPPCRASLPAPRRRRRPRRSQRTISAHSPARCRSKASARWIVPRSPTCGSARMTDYDRVVIEFDEGIPPFTLDEATPPLLADPSGMEMDVEGSAFWSLVLQGGTRVDGRRLDVLRRADRLHPRLPGAGRAGRGRRFRGGEQLVHRPPCVDLCPGADPEPSIPPGGRHPALTRVR